MKTLTTLRTERDTVQVTEQVKTHITVQAIAQVTVQNRQHVTVPINRVGHIPTWITNVIDKKISN